MKPTPQDKFGQVTNLQKNIDVIFHCPGCKILHQVWVSPKPDDQPNRPTWTFNGDMINPTIHPSLLVRNGNKRVCHSFIKNGMIQFLNDCTHKLSGQTVQIPLIKDNDE